MAADILHERWGKTAGRRETSNFPAISSASVQPKSAEMSAPCGWSEARWTGKETYGPPSLRYSVDQTNGQWRWRRFPSLPSVKHPQRMQPDQSHRSGADRDIAEHFLHKLLDHSPNYRFIATASRFIILQNKGTMGRLFTLAELMIRKRTEKNLKKKQFWKKNLKKKILKKWKMKKKLEKWNNFEKKI